MGTRAYNFNAGPAALPLAVLEQAQKELVEYRGIGMSLMEISHRSTEYEALNAETQELLKSLVGIPDGYKIMFLQGGASTQFAMIPLNFLGAGKVGSYVHTGAWAEKALKEAQQLGFETHVAANMEAESFMRMPNVDEIELLPNAAYLHLTSNETIGGAQFQTFPNTGDVPLIADMSSDILSRPVDVSKFAMIYAGAQKNLGPSGVTLVILREDMLQHTPKNIPTMMKYDIHAKNDSLYNTPPVYSVYIMNLVLKWIQEQGGVAAVQQVNNDKTKLIYDTIDASGGFYVGPVDPGSRSKMNITFRMGTEELEKQFAKEALAAGFVGLKGHRSVGGLRASTYNAVPYEACAALVSFMKDFQQRNG